MNPLLSLSSCSDVPVPSLLKEWGGGGGNISSLTGSPGYYYPRPILFIYFSYCYCLNLNSIYLSVTVFTFDFTILINMIYFLDLVSGFRWFLPLRSFDQVQSAIYYIGFCEIIQISLGRFSFATIDRYIPRSQV